MPQFDLLSFLNQSFWIYCLLSLLVIFLLQYIIPSLNVIIEYRFKYFSFLLFSKFGFNIKNLNFFSYLDFSKKKKIITAHSV